MTFATPLALLVLVLVPVLVAGRAAAERRRARAAAAFAASPMMPSVAPHRPRWRRQLPLLAYVLAILLLALACAGPRVTAMTAVGHLKTMIAIDVSGSMAATDVKPNRITAAQRAADVLVGEAPPQIRFGIMQFNQSPAILLQPSGDRRRVFAALGQLRISGGTAIGAAIGTSLGMLAPGSHPSLRSARSGTSHGPRGVIVLVSDGKSTSGSDPIAQARLAHRLRIPIFTISLGTSRGTISVRKSHGTGTVQIHVPPEPAELARIARVSGGRAYTAADAKQLSAIFRHIGADIAQRREHRDITTAILAAGMALALIGGAMSLGWFGRLI